MEGWISLSRKIFDCWIWKETPFSRAQAWIDLLLLANYERRKFVLGNELVEVERGSFITSETKLMNRWGWGKGKTRSFLSLLEKDDMIIKKTDHKRTTITIVNYSKYQDTHTTDRPITDCERTDNGLSSDCERTDSGLIADSTNNNNNINNINNINNGNKESAVAEQTDYQSIVDDYNNTCKSLPQVKTLSDARRKAIKARVRTRGLEEIHQSFVMAEQSSFLKGSNKNNWTASFDWIMNDTNMAKILDGNYENRTPSGNEDGADWLLRQIKEGTLNDIG